jgi:hypothetical protein
LPGTQRDAWRNTLATIIDGLLAIQQEEPIETDPIGEELTARLTAILGQEDARITTALIYGTDQYTASLAGFPVPFTFPAAIAGRIAYDAARKQLKLLGALTKTDKVLLDAAFGVPPAILPAYKTAVNSLFLQPRAFTARALKSMYTAAEAEAILIDISSLKPDGTPLTVIITTKVADISNRRRILLSRNQVKQTLAGSTGLSAEIMEQLLENDEVLKALSGTGSAMEDFQDLNGTGLDAAYFSGRIAENAATCC